MRFDEMLLKRESCRAFRGIAVAREDLVKICEAGRLSPSGCNSQPWKFVIIDEAEAKEKLCDALVLPNGKTSAAFRHDCGGFIIIVEQQAKLIPSALEYFGDSQRFAQGDIGIASMNMCYQAMELGLSTCMIGMHDREKLSAVFDIPKTDEIRLVLAVGYGVETDAPRPKMRKPLEEVVCFNHWK